MLTKLRSFLVCTILLSAAATAFAATLNVGAGQTYTTIQSAINAANNGDTVLVAPGTYFENIDFKGKAITVTSSGGSASTIIDGGNKGPVVQFLNGELRSSVISGFTLQHGGLSNGINTTDQGQVDAGVLIYQAAPSILNNNIQQNYCYGVDAEQSSPLIQNNEISGTIYQPGYWCDGVAIGSGVLIDGAFGEPGEQLGVIGSGSFVPSIFPTITGNTIENNNSAEDASSSGGGGIHVLYGYTIIQNNIVRNNFSQQAGGGITVSIYNDGFYDTVLILQNLIYGNTSACGGGGLAFNQSTVDGIGAPYYYVENNTIVDNVDSNQCADVIHPDGSQVYIWQDSDRFVFVNNIIAGESDALSAVYCETLREEDPGLHLAIFDHNDIYNSQGGSIGGECVNQTGTYGNVAVDPLFVNRAAQDFHLTANSPLLDAGNSSAAFLPSQDFAGSPRLEDATGAGYPIVDMGAYEAAGAQDANSTILTLTPSTYQVSLGAPVTLTASLLSANGVPTGSIAFLEDNQSIGSSAIDSAGVATVQTSTLTAGVHAFVATYAGQGSFTPATSVKIFLVIGASTTDVTLTSSLNPSSVGQSVTFTVTSQSNYSTVPSPITLTDGSTVLAIRTPDSSGNATYVTNALTAGLHQLTATYAGDATHPGTQATLTQVVKASSTPGPTSTAIVSSSNPSTYLQPVTFTAHVTSAGGIPTGSVVFTEAQNTLATAPVDANGNASFTIATLSANDLGTTSYHLIDATFVPTGGYSASSASVSQVVNGLTSNTALTVTPTSGTTAATFTMTATVASASPSSNTTPTGAVVFYTSAQTGITGNELGYATLINGTATFTSTGLLSGTDYIVGIYFGDGIYASSTSNFVTLTVIAAPTTLTLTPTANPSPALAPITFNAHLATAAQPLANTALTLTYNPTGVAQVVIPLTTDANGNASFTLASGLTPGSYPVAASYAATANYQASSSAVTEIVTANPTTTTLSATPNPANQTNAVGLTAIVTATAGTDAPFGTITFLDGATPLATVALTGSSTTSTATFTLTTLSVGTHALTAIYTPGSASFLASQSTPFSETINPQDFTLTANPPSLSIQTQHRSSMQLTLTSIGGFAAPITFTCGSPLPPFATCYLPPQTSLAANATVNVTFGLDTDGSPKFYGANRSSNLSRIALAALLPFTLFVFRKRRLRNLLACAILSVLAVTLTACANTYPDHTPPGVYTVPITATGTASGSTVPTSHSLNITLTVTP